MRKIVLVFVVCLLASVVVQAQTNAANRNALILELQEKLDKWHGAGKFPGATLGVALANGESIQGYAGPNNPFGGTDEMIVNGKFVINPQFEWTGGGFASTAQDLARWAKLFYEGKAFSPDLLPQVLDGVPAPMLGRETRYGLGTIIRKTKAGTSYGHSGFFPGYITEMMYFPEHRVAVAVQVNTSVPANLGKPLGRVLVEVMEVITRHLNNAG
jgi:CubicO group peptidase (beta-lactamase class C family)